MSARWSLLIDCLAGRPWPALPPRPGRLHLIADDGMTGAERDELLADPAVTDGTAATVLGLSVQRIRQLRQQARNHERTTT